MYPEDKVKRTFFCRMILVFLVTFIKEAHSIEMNKLHRRMMRPPSGGCFGDGERRSINYEIYLSIDTWLFLP